jgi:hypothetical protein
VLLNDSRFFQQIICNHSTNRVMLVIKFNVHVFSKP